MVFAYKGDRFGSAQQAMKVADPVILTPALPRFLTPGDSIQMQVTAFNTTAQEAALTIEVKTTGGVTAPVKSTRLSVGANQERYIRLPLKATDAIGKAVVTVSTTAFGEKIESVTELPVRPAAPLASESVSGFVEGGSRMTQSIGDVYLPYNRKAYLALSPFPAVNLAPRLKHLVGYPHGCLEQTVSKAFPQIYLRDIAVILAPEILASGSPAYFVNEAITKIASLQTPAGDFLYWPEGGYTNDWTTVYATHFLLEAKRAGYAVPEGVLKNALAAVGTIARGKKTEDYYSYSGGKITVRRIADKSAVYGLFVLAAAGSPEKSVMNFYRIEKSLLTEDTRVLLASAFALSGDRKTYTEILPPKFEPEDARRTTGGDFDSPVRSAAIMLYAMLETDLNNPSIGRALEYLSSIYKGNGWYSTQDDAFALLAFGKAARMTAAGKADGTVSVGSRKVAYRGETMKIDLQDFGGSVSFASRGPGRTYYSLVTEGIRKDGRVRIEDQNLQIRREFLDRNGKAVSLSGIRQNTLLVVRLTLRASVDALENIAITDLLPAGFEIDNPRISETTTYAFVKNQATPRYMDIRDDRINLYTDISYDRREQVFYYIVRAVTPGVFRYPAVVAETMYSGDYYSAHGEGIVKIE
jgi:alpha-2-macroglobulin